MLFVADAAGAYRIGAIRPVSVKVKTNLQTYSTAEVILTTEEARKNQNVLQLYNTLHLDCGGYKDYFAIHNVSIGDEYATLSCKHITSYFENTVVIKNTNTLATRELYRLIAHLYDSTNDSSTSGVQSNNMIITVSSSQTRRLRPKAFYKGADGNMFLTGATFQAPHSSETKWLEKFPLAGEFFGKTMDEIIKDMIDEHGFNVFYLQDSVIFTYETLSTLFTFLRSHSSVFTYYSQLELKDANFFLDKQFFPNDQSSVSVSATTDNFIATITPYYDLESNDRNNKTTSETCLYNGTSLREAYNTSYKSIYGTDACQKYKQIVKYSPTSTWDRYMKFSGYMYKNQEHYSTSEVAFVKKYKQDVAITSQSIGPIYIYNAKGTLLSSSKYLSAVNTWINWYVSDDGQTLGGHLRAQVSSETEDAYVYSVCISIKPQYFGMIKIGGTVSDASIANFTDKNETDIKVYDAFGDEYGKIDLSVYTPQQGSPLRTYNIVSEVEKSDGTTSCEVAGYATFAANQLYADYKTSIETEVLSLAQADVDSYNYETCLQNVSLEFQLDRLKTAVLPGNTLSIWNSTFEQNLEFLVASVTYDEINGTYDNIEVGYKKQVLYDLSRSQKTAEDTTAGINKEIKAVKKTLNKLLLVAKK